MARSFVLALVLLGCGSAPDPFGGTGEMAADGGAIATGGAVATGAGGAANMAVASGGAGQGGGAGAAVANGGAPAVGVYWACLGASTTEPFDCNVLCARKRYDGTAGKKCSPTGCDGNTVLYFDPALAGCGIVGGTGANRESVWLPPSPPAHVTHGCDPGWLPPTGMVAICCCE